MEGYILSAAFFFNSLLIVVLCHYKPKYYKEILRNTKQEKSNGRNFASKAE